jgi:hypothetical protein
VLQQALHGPQLLEEGRWVLQQALPRSSAAGGRQAGAAAGHPRSSAAGGRQAGAAAGLAGSSAAGGCRQALLETLHGCQLRRGGGKRALQQALLGCHALAVHGARLGRAEAVVGGCKLHSDSLWPVSACQVVSQSVGGVWEMGGQTARAVLPAVWLD